MPIQIYETKPNRTYTGREYTRYREYKIFLRDDFNKRCGYCDGLDLYAGGKRGFQIDHFKPKKLFPDLETKYENLVYSCSFCNRAKWDKWEDSNGFVDPCNDLYSMCLSRNAKGQIEYSNNQGEYIYVNLKLHIRRHELIWIIEKLKNQNQILIDLSDRLGNEHNDAKDILIEFMNIQKEINKYTNLFYDEI